jgi:hypothetical protein
MSEAHAVGRKSESSNTRSNHLNGSSRTCRPTMLRPNERCQRRIRRRANGFVQTPGRTNCHATKAGLGLLAHVLVAEFADHLPLYCQSLIYARKGVDLDRRCWRVGLAPPAHCSARLSRRSANTYWQRPNCTLTTLPCVCSSPAGARPGPDGCEATAGRRKTWGTRFSRALALVCRRF